MADLTTEIAESVFTAKGKNCPTPSLETDEIGASGAGISGEEETTELVEIRKEAERMLNNWGDDVPSTPDEVTQYTIDKYFGKNWKGAFPRCDQIVEKKKSTLVTSFAYYANLIDYIMQTLGLGSVNDLISSIVPSSVMKMYGHWLELSQDWSNISMCITNFKEFKFCTENPMAILQSTDALLQNIEQTILAVDGGIDHLLATADDLMGFFSDGKTLEDAISQFGQKIEDAAGKIIENISNLPESVMNAFKNCQFIQNMFSLPQRILAHCASIVAIITSIRSPTCLKDFVDIIRTLRQAVAEAKNAAATIQNAVAQVQAIKESISKGNWMGVLGQLNQGSGCAKQAFNIVEHPSSFAAKYPANSAYTTYGGHIIELDNTKDHERIHVQHKAGTSVEMSPEGDMHSKVKKDFQLMVDGNIEINSNKKVTITGKNGVKIDYGGTTFQMDKTSMGMGGQSGNINVDKMAMTTEKANIVSATTLTLGSALETSVSATKALYLSSAIEIVMKAPKISIIAEGPGITMKSYAGTLIGSGIGVGFGSTTNTAISADKVGIYKAGSANQIGAGVNIIGKIGG